MSKLSTSLKWFAPVMGVSLLAAVSSMVWVAKADEEEVTDQTATIPAAPVNTVYISGMSQAQGNPTDPNFVPPTLVQVQAVDGATSSSSAGTLIMVPPQINGTVPVYPISQVVRPNNGQVQFVLAGQPGGNCIFTQSNMTMQCSNLGDLGNQTFVLAPTTVVTLAQPYASSLYATYNAMLTPEWATIARDLDCRKFPNVACHVNAYPSTEHWNAFLSKFNQFAAAVNQSGNPQLQQDTAAMANQIATIQVNPSNSGQMKIPRDTYIQIKSLLLKIRSDLQQIGYIR